MIELLQITLLGLFFGTFGTTLGGILGLIVKSPSNKFLSFILSLAGGLMTAILSFDLIPEALQISDIKSTLIGIISGILCMIICNIIVEKKFTDNNLEGIAKRNPNSRASSTNINLLKAGIITSIGLAIHNLPEGLAIGSGFGASIKLGYSLAVAICIHDIPEGRFQSRHQVKNAWKKIWIQIYSTKKYGIFVFFLFEWDAIGMKIENADIWVLTEEWCHILMCGGKDALS